MTIRPSTDRVGQAVIRHRWFASVKYRETQTTGRKFLVVSMTTSGGLVPLRRRPEQAGEPERLKLA
jgi:hypothetical protein